MKHNRGELEGATQAITAQAIDELGVRVLPFGAAHGFRLFDLPLHHADPFDRMIVAQALA